MSPEEFPSKPALHQPEQDGEPQVGESKSIDRPGELPSTPGPNVPGIVAPFESFGRSAIGNTRETVALPTHLDDASGKQEKDLAFVVSLVHSGLINERQLARAVDGWTVFGKQPLAERIVDQKLISNDEKETLVQEALDRLRSAEQTLSQDGAGGNVSIASRAKIAQLDTSGRLSRILGLSNYGVYASPEDGRQLFSRFSLIRKLGEGGLGTVWLARDENLRRYVAIKEIRSAGSNNSAGAVARFRREAEVTGRLEHPGIVPIYQFGTDSDTGNFFYVMRFLGKQTMHDAILEYHERREAGNDEPLLMHRLLNSFVKLCYSVAHAHSRQVVHRDLKPENVALDNFGEVVLLDWGLAKINDETGAADAALEMSEDAVDDPNLTMANQVLGSPMYMAPEQAAGRIDEIDERTDVYGLGGILYAILTGHAPHEQSSDDVDPWSISDVLESIVSKPTTRAREVNPSIPGELDAVCHKAMQKKRYLRYAEASDIAEDVERFMAGDKVSAYNEPWSRQIKRWITAHPRISQLFAVVGTLMFLSVATVGYSLRHTQVAQNAFRFQRSSDIAKELAFNLQSAADNLIKDTRFLTGLPLVQAIIQDRQSDQNGIGTGTENSAVGTLLTQAAEQPEQPQPYYQMSATFDGILQRNESYLNIALVELDEDQAMQILRSERNTGADLVRQVPRSLLASFARTEDSPAFETMLPGDVVLQTSDQINENAPTNYRDSLSLTAINTVFDQEDGELFGLIAIQVDLRRLIRERIESVSHDESTVYVTDGNGVIEMVYQQGGFSKAYLGKLIGDVLPEVGIVFMPNSAVNSHTDGATFYAKRMTLGELSSKSQAQVGIVVTNR